MGTVSIINICITVNVLVIAFILSIKKTGNVRANRLLAFILLCNSILNILNVLLLSRLGGYRYFAHWEYIAGFAAGPTIYLYVLENTGQKSVFNFKTLIQYILVPVTFVLYILYLLKPAGEKQIFLDSIYGYKNMEYAILDSLFYLQFTFYLVFCLVVIYKNKKDKEQFYSSLEKVKLNWLFTFLLTLLIMDLAALPIGTMGLDTLGQYIPILSSLIYLVVVYKAFTQPSIFSEYEEFKESIINKAEPTMIKPAFIQNGNAEIWIAKINQYMEQQKPYLNKDLTIKILAEGIEIPSYQLSQLINQHYKKNFFDFINTYRVNEAKLNLLNPKYANLKIESLGEMAGFNSRTSFFSIFKKHLQLTPAEFRKQSTDIQVFEN
jgi:AraC-like DNA-binding protein